MKKLIQFTIAALVIGLVASASAVTVTNADGTTITVNTLSELRRRAGATIVEDQSKL